MARTTGRSGFKMRSGNSPLREEDNGTSGGDMRKKTLGGEINRFFSDLHTGLQAGAQRHSDWKAKRKEKIAEKAKASPDGLTNFQRRQADRAAQRESGGKSKYQRDIIKKQADRKATKAAEVAGTEPYDIKSSSIFDSPTFGHEGKSFFSPTTSNLDRELIMQDTKRKIKEFGYKPTTPEWKQDKYKSKWLYKKNLDGSYTTKKGESGKEIKVEKGDESYDAIASVFKKKSPAKIYDKKGKRRKNYKY